MHRYPETDRSVSKRSCSHDTSNLASQHIQYDVTRYVQADITARTLPSRRRRDCDSEEPD